MQHSSPVPLATVLAVCVLYAPAGAQGRPPTAPGGLDAEVLQSGPDRLDFGRLPIEQPFEHTFIFRNDTAETLELADVQLTPPLSAIKGTPRVAPGALGSISVRLGQPRTGGRFEGEIVLSFRQPSAMPRTFVVTGMIVPPVELQPSSGLYIATQRGVQAAATIEIVIHRSEPIDVLGLEYAGTKFTPQLETITPGRHYKVTATVRAEAPAGRTSEMVRLRTSDPSLPLMFPVNVVVIERVYTFPDVVNLGAIRLDALKAPPVTAAMLDQTLMVYQTGGKNFQVSATTDLPFLVLNAEKSPLGDRYQITVSVVAERLRVGPIRGSITITTNDPEFPQLVVPVEGAILNR